MEKRKYVTPNESGVAILCAIAAMYIFSYAWLFISSAIPYKGATLHDSDIYSWVSTFLTQGSILAAVLILCKVRNVSYLSLVNFKRGLNAKQFGLVIAISITCIFAFLPLANIFVQLVDSWGYQSSSGTLPDFTSNGGLFFLGLFAICVLPAVCEESLFRGVFLNSNKGYGYILSIVLTGLGFGIFHGNAMQLIHQSLVGMVWAFMVLSSRSIWASSIAHFLNNSVSLSASLLLNYLMRIVDDGNDEMVAIFRNIFCEVSAEDALEGISLNVSSVFISLGVSAVGLFVLFLLLKKFAALCVLRQEKETNISYYAFKQIYNKNLAIENGEGGLDSDGIFDTDANDESDTDVKSGSVFSEFDNNDDKGEATHDSDSFFDSVNGNRNNGYANHTGNPHGGYNRNDVFKNYASDEKPLNVFQRFCRMMAYLQQGEPFYKEDKESPYRQRPLFYYAAWGLIVILWLVDFILGFIKK